MFIGRDEELNELDRLYRAKAANLLVMYGRRRVGKSVLIEKFMEGKISLQFEGLENVHTKGQIEKFVADLAKQINDPLLKNIKVTNWLPLLDYLTEYFSKQSSKSILFLDEFQWLASNQSKLVSLIKNYWDKFWKKQNVMLILCGSVSSFMVKRVIKSKALYGRINYELCLQPFSPKEVVKLLDHKRDASEIFLYNLILGGIPKYLQEIDLDQSFEQNMNRLFFLKNSLFANEYERIFYSQFKEHKTYENIAKLLKNTPLSLQQLSDKTKIPSGGGLRFYLQNLEYTNFITSYVPYNKNLNSKLMKYKLTDEYLRFYYKYIEPNLRLIRENQRRDLFSQIVKPVWNPWLGFAFENFCMKNAYYLAEIMGFANQVLHWGPLFNRDDTGFQVDLIYLRQDNVITLCEMKFHSKPIGVSVIKEVEYKCKLLTVPRGYTIERALITRFGVDSSLQELNYFHHVVEIKDLF
jgi:hypothetical protein